MDSSDRGKGQYRSFVRDERAIKWTLQAYLFLLILLGGVVMAAGTLPTERAPTELADFQRQQTAEDLLSTTAGTGALEESLLYWNATSGHWLGAAGGYSDQRYTTLRTTPDHPLWPAVKVSTHRQQLAYNIVAEYQVDADGDGVAETTRSESIVQQGPPGYGAVTASKSVILTDDDTPRHASVSSDGDACTLGEMSDKSSVGTDGCRTDSYLAPDSAPDSTRYNVIQIRVTVWSV